VKNTSKKSFFNNLKRLNKFAQQLRDRRFRQRVIVNKKAYDRKKKLLEIYTGSS
jgi:hypothetical protein